MAEHARKFGAALRALDKRALRTMRNALIATGGNLVEAAALCGLAGSSSFWRIAYETPRVMRILITHGRRPWEIVKGVSRFGQH